MELLRQRAQRLREQPDLGHPHAELAGLGPEELAAGADDVADVVFLELLVVHALGQRVALHEELDAPGDVLQVGEARPAHDALGHQPPGHADGDGVCLQGNLVVVAVGRLQAGRERVATEIVGVGVAPVARRGELVAALLDLLVVVPQAYRRFFFFMIHINVL